MRRVLWAVVVLGVVACKDDGLSPESIAGTYPFFEVVGHEADYFHPLPGTVCSANFTGGSLTVSGNGNFSLDLDYLYRCTGVADLALELRVTGSESRTIGEALILTGCHFISQQQPCEYSSLEVVRESDLLTVRLLNATGARWGDIEFRLGPRQ